MVPGPGAMGRNEANLPVPKGGTISSVSAHEGATSMVAVAATIVQDDHRSSIGLQIGTLRCGLDQPFPAHGPVSYHLQPPSPTIQISVIPQIQNSLVCRSVDRGS